MITFRNNATTIPGWVPSIHRDHPISYAYRSGDYLVSIYGRDTDLYVMSTGLTVSHKVEAEISSWAATVFGASNIQKIDHEPGRAVRGVWRPGLYRLDQTREALGTTAAQQLSAEQALHLLIERLYEILLFVEPTTPSGNASFGHKTRELLILAATEVENALRRHARDAGLDRASNGHPLTTKDYVRMKDALHLSEFEVTLRPYAEVAPVRPFQAWRADAPTKSLEWYDAYNKTKHDRETHFHEASLATCIDAVSAAVVLFMVRFGPHALIEGGSIVSTHFNQLFSVRLVEPDVRSFYVPKINAGDRVANLVCDRGTVEPWTTMPLVI